MVHKPPKREGAARGQGLFMDHKSESRAKRTCSFAFVDVGNALTIFELTNSECLF